MRRAVCALVKTPGLSPIKTRLAAGIGADAGDFYKLSVAAVESVLQQLAQHHFGQPYWAVAEALGLGQWSSFPAIWQGDGGLAARLDHIYAALINNYHSVYLLGADCPQISADIFVAAAAALDKGAAFAIGPARDGGFYLLAGQCAIAPEVWHSVPMSTADTGARLCAALAPYGRVELLEPRSDVDTVTDLATTRAELAALAGAALDAQKILISWLDRKMKTFSPSN